MRVAALLIVPGLALLLLAAHMLHAGWLPLAVLSLLLLALLWIRRPWAARVLQAVLGVATIEWALTAYSLAHLRMDHGQPYLRLVLILGGVALFTAVAALLFQRASLRRYFGLGDRTA